MLKVIGISVCIAVAMAILAGSAVTQMEWTRNGPLPDPDVKPGWWDDRITFGAGSVVIDVDEPDPTRRYKMWYHVGSPKIPRIGLVMSEDGFDWEKFDADNDGYSDPVFEAKTWDALNEDFGHPDLIGNGLLGGTYDWDKARATSPAVLVIEDTDPYPECKYKMWYTGADSGDGKYQIGLAVSKDGIKWKKHTVNGESVPVLSTTEDPNALDSLVVGNPWVEFDSSKSEYKMWYVGNDSSYIYRIFLATSSDGIQWEKYDSPDDDNLPDPVLKESETAGCFDSEGPTSPSIFIHQTCNDPLYEMWYSSYQGSYQRIGYAISSDGIHWVKYNKDGQGCPDPAIPLGETGTWDSLRMDLGSVLFDVRENKYKMWYAGSNSTAGSTMQTGYATAIPDAIYDHIGPIVSNLQAAPNPVAISNPTDLTATVDDSTTGGSDIVAAKYMVEDSAGIVIIDWSDMIPVDGVFDTSTEEVKVTISGFSEPGVYTIWVKGIDSACNESNEVQMDFIYLAVYNPNGGFVTGGGWIDSPAGACRDDESASGKANFGFVSKYKKGTSVPTGNTEFNFKAGDLNFHSDEYEWLVVNQDDSNAQYKGKGTINGELAGNGELYKFMLWASDHDPDGDTFRIKIWYEISDTETVVYDNGFDQTIGGGNIKIHSGDSAAPARPSEFALLQNYPNSFNPDTWIPYQLAEDVNVAIRIYNVTGRLVRTLNLGHRLAGFYTTRSKAAYWDGKNEAGEQAASGIYFYTIQAGEFTSTKKMILAK